MDATDAIQFHVAAAIDEGITLGLLESIRVLNQFIDLKVSRNLPEYITREELTIFLTGYIEQWKEVRRGKAS